MDLPVGGGKENVLSVRAPAQHLAAMVQVCHAPRAAARSRHEIDFRHTFLAADKGQQFAIGRQHRIVGFTQVAGQPSGQATLGRAALCRCNQQEGSVTEAQKPTVAALTPIAASNPEQQEPFLPFALPSIGPDEVGDVTEALDFAASLALGQPETTVILYSDGAFALAGPPPPGRRPVLVCCPASGGGPPRRAWSSFPSRRRVGPDMCFWANPGPPRGWARPG